MCHQSYDIAIPSRLPRLSLPRRQIGPVMTPVGLSYDGTTGTGSPGTIQTDTGRADMEHVLHPWQAACPKSLYARVIGQEKLAAVYCCSLPG